MFKNLIVKISMVALLFCAVAGLSVSQAQASVSVQGRWSEAPVAYMIKNGSYPGNGFISDVDPTSPCPRGTFAEMIVRSLGMKEGNQKNIKFADANGQYAKAAETLASQGLAYGSFTDGVRYFMPTSPLIRAEAATFTVRLLGPIPSANGSSRFWDIRNGDWYFDSVNHAALKKLVVGYTDGSFRPNINVSYEEAATIVYNYVVNNGQKYVPQDQDGDPVETKYSPRNLEGEFNEDKERVELSWDEPSYDDSDIDTYKVYRNGDKIKETTSTSFNDEDYEEGEENEYYVVAVFENDKTGKSKTIEVDTTDNSGGDEESDTNSKYSPRNLEGEFNEDKERVELSWDEPSYDDSDIDTYKVYRNGDKIKETTSTSFNDEDYEEDEVNEYYVVAVFENDKEGKSKTIEVDTTDNGGGGDEESDVEIISFSLCTDEAKVGEQLFANFEIHGEDYTAELWIGDDKHDPYGSFTVDQPGEYTSVLNVKVDGKVVDSKNFDLTVTN